MATNPSPPLLLSTLASHQCHQKANFLTADFGSQKVISQTVAIPEVTVLSDTRNNALEDEIKYFAQSITSGNDRRNRQRDVAGLAIAREIESQIIS